jgi:hypothetical protein
LISLKFNLFVITDAYYFEERPIFGKEDLILEHKQQVARKQHAEKEGKQHARGKATWQGGRKA